MHRSLALSAFFLLADASAWAERGPSDEARPCWLIEQELPRAPPMLSLMS